MRFVQPILTGILLSTVVSGAFAQAQPADKKPPQQPQATKPAPASQKSAGAGKTTSAAKTGQAPARPDAKSAVKPPAAPAKKAQAPAKPAVKPPAKAAGKGPQVVGKKPTKAVKKAPAPGTPPPAQSETKIARRDPFESLIGRQLRQGQSGPAIPGKPGLVIATLRVDGIVRTPDLMIAIVTNPQQRTYFLREGDQLFDGRVEKIMMDSVSFHEVGKDAFGKPVERQVNKRIYPSSGETQ